MALFKYMKHMYQSENEAFDVVGVRTGLPSMATWDLPMCSLR